MVIVAAFNESQRVPDRERVALRRQKSRTPEGYQVNDVAQSPAGTRTQTHGLSRSYVFLTHLLHVSCTSRSSPACKWSRRTTHWSAEQSKPDGITPPNGRPQLNAANASHSHFPARKKYFREEVKMGWMDELSGDAPGRRRCRKSPAWRTRRYVEGCARRMAFVAERHSRRRDPER